MHVTVVVPLANVEPEGGAQDGAPTPGQLSLTTGAAYVTTAEHKPRAAGVVMLAAQAIDGGCASFTVTVNEHEAVLLDVSVATQETVVAPFGKAEPDAGVQVAVTPGQLSLGVGANVTTAEQRFGSVFLTILAGHVMVGACASLTVTVNEQVAVLLEASVATHDTVVMPFGKAEPDGGVQSVVAPEQLSVVVGVKVTIAEHTFGSVFLVIFAGQVTTGACVSLTVTVNEQVVEVPSSLCPVTTTVVVPTGKNDPDAGLALTTPQFPVKVGAGKLTMAPHWSCVFVAVIFAGHVRTHASSQHV
jgi:hypothetical protein